MKKITNVTRLNCSVHEGHVYYCWKKIFFCFKYGQSAYVHFRLKPLFNQCARNCAACVWGWRWGQWVSVAEGEQVSIPQTEVFNIHRKLYNIYNYRFTWIRNSHLAYCYFHLSKFLKIDLFENCYYANEIEI